MGAGLLRLVLLIIDGLGLGEASDHNAVARAHTPVLDDLFLQYPHAQLTASGEAVGLLPGQMGNSNVGHLNLGAGRIVFQDLTRIHRAIDDGSLFRNEELVAAVRTARDSGRALHLAGLVSDGGVHSHTDHVVALCELARRHDVERVFVHAFLDGRDVPPRSARGYIENLEQRMGDVGSGVIATVTGRYYAMDRDQRWDRTELALDTLLRGKGLRADSAVNAVEDAYRRDETDEFVRPTLVCEQGVIEPGDVVILFNFRADRMRQLLRGLVDPDCPGLNREGFRPVRVTTMTEYDRSIRVPVAFLSQDIRNTLGEVVSAAGWRQYRVAETEKYAHVTYFLSGGREEPFPGEDRELVPSPDVATYDLTPEMSAARVTDCAVRAIRGGEYHLVIINYANPDMVGHTGVLSAAVTAVETVDACVGRVAAATREAQSQLVIVSDHGNAELMKDEESGQPHTAHTVSPVPLIVAGSRPLVQSRGILADVAPTCLDLMGLEVPGDMEGTSLVGPVNCERRG